MALNARYPPASLISIGLVILNLCSFVVLLGGAAALQKNANQLTELFNLVNSQPGSILSFGDIKPINTPGNIISYEWFKAVFQVVTLLIILGALATGQLYRFRIALVGLCAALAVLFSDAAHTFYYIFLQVKDNPLVNKKLRRSVEAYFAGCIMTATLNYLQVFSLGIGLEPRHHDAVGPGAGTNAPGVKDTGNGAAHTGTAAV